MNISLAELRRIVERYGQTLLIFTVCLVLALLCRLFLVKKYYRSEAELLVSFTREVSDARGRELVTNEPALLQSRDTLLAVARHIAGPQTSHRDVQKLCDYLAQRLEVSTSAGSNVVSVGITLPNPLQARHALGAILREYLARRVESPQGSAARWGNHGGEDAAQIKAENDLAEFERDNSVFDERQVVVLNQSREDLQLNLNALSNDFAYAQRKLDNTRELLRRLPDELLLGATEVDNENYTALAERLEALKAERNLLLRRLMPDRAAIAERDEEIRKLEEALSTTPKTVPDPDEKLGREAEARDYLNRQMLELMPEVAAQQARMDSLKAQIREIDEALLRNSETRARLTALREAARAAREDAGKDVDNSADRAPTPQAALATVSIIAAPSFSPDPVGPSAGAFIVGALIVWAAGCLLMLRFLPRFDERLVFPSQAREILRLPVLAELVPPAPAEESASDLPPFERYKDAFAELYDALPHKEGQAVVLLFAAPEEKTGHPTMDGTFLVEGQSEAAPEEDPAEAAEQTESPEAGAIAEKPAARQRSGKADALLREEKAIAAFRREKAATAHKDKAEATEEKEQATATLNTEKAAHEREKAMNFSPAEAFTAHIQSFQQKKPVFIRYVQEAPSAAAGQPTRLGGRRGPGTEPPKRPALSSRPVGLTMYERSAGSVAREKSLWDKLKEDNDILVVEYAPVRRGPLLSALAETADAAVVSLRQGQSETKAVRRCLAMLRQAGASIAGILWIDE
jgi:capsular polysaccharide biosynthesis protein